MRKRLAWPLGVRVVRDTLGLGVTLALSAVLAAAGSTPALAHEERAAAGVELVVGWGDEPAYTGFRNSVEITVSEPGGRPVTDVGDGLKVEVIKGSEKVTLSLEANFGGPSGTPGTYRAWLTPTRPGSYTFHLMGRVRRQNVDESFTSSPTTFDEVQDVANIQFPAKDPSPGELAARMDREVSRIEARTDAVEAAVADEQDRADSARTVAIAGVVAGALGLLAGGAALLAARRASPRNGGPTTGRSKAGAEHAESFSR
jgi:hypothetical protein